MATSTLVRGTEYLGAGPAGAGGPHPVTPRVAAGNGLLLPHVRTFSALYNTFSRVYSYRWDEAVRYGRQNPDAMHRDAFLRSLEQERLMPLTGWRWDVEADPDEDDRANPKDPRSADREQVRRQLAAVARRTPHLADLRRYLGLSLWFGRYGSQVAWVKRPVGGFDRWCVGVHQPIDGDKIQFDWDGVPGVMIRPGDARAWPDVRYFDGGAQLAMLSTPEIRQRFVISRYFIEDAGYWDAQGAGRVQGVGYRDFVYWAWWLRDEMLSWLTDFMEKVGNLGLLLFYFEDGNPASEQKAKEQAANVDGRNALAVPIPRGGDRKTSGVELVPANMTGVQFLKEVVGDYFERHIERLIVGQSMSSGSDAEGSLGGTGRAEFAKDTKFHLLRFDAEKQQECLTEEFLAPIKDLNYRDAPGRYFWRYKLPDPEADKKLEAVAKAATIPGRKLEFKADEIRDLVGLTKPEAGDEVVGGEEVQPDAGAGGPHSGAA